MLQLLAALAAASAPSEGARPVDESSVAAMLKAMEEQMAAQSKQLHDEMAQLHDEMAKKDEMIAALKAKTEHRQVQLTAGGEVMQLVSEADFKVLAARVAACEKTNADQDAKLGMTMDTLSKVRKEIKDGRVGAPPAPPRPVAKPGRRLQSSSIEWQR